jgi:Uma2 family endonuclease
MPTLSLNWHGVGSAVEAYSQELPMSTVERPTIETIPPLEPGQRLDRAEFRARYEAMPPETRAELIGGVVFMPPMLGSDHGDSHIPVAGIFFIYQSATPGVRANIESTTVLDHRNEVQPDCSLRILEASGGQTRTIPEWIEGAPELVVEIARSSRSIDLGPKLEEYRRAGVIEYVVLAIDPNEVFWHERIGEAFSRVTPGEDGVYRSKMFPGLWFDPAAFFRGDAQALIATIEAGLASPEHADFVAELARRRVDG